MRALIAATTMVFGFGMPLLAQGRGTVDLGAGARYTIVDRDVSPEDAIGFGAHVGYFVIRNFAVELAGAMTTAAPAVGPDVTFTPFYARLAYHRQVLTHLSGAVFGGGVMDRTDPGGGVTFSDPGFTAGGAIIYRINSRYGVRADLIGDAILKPFGSSPAAPRKTGNIHLQLGVNIRLRGDPLTTGPRDSDKDGIEDAMDACPRTTAATRVDLRGCEAPPDADGDGIADSNDRCASTPSGTRVDANGCTADADGDGVLDASDRCVGTSIGTRVDATGCAVVVAPPDTDRDGVVDPVDACAGTAAGTRVDARGCPVPVDTDGDGVLDSADNCPGTATGTAVVASGCARVFPEGKTTMVLEGISFAPGWAELTPATKTILDRLAATLIASDANVEIGGYTDNTGSQRVNTALSLARAGTVRAYLITKGVPAGRITAKGYGPASPAAPNTTAAGRALNRRVELKRTN